MPRITWLNCQLSHVIRGMERFVQHLWVRIPDTKMLCNEITDEKVLWHETTIMLCSLQRACGLV